MHLHRALTFEFHHSYASELAGLYSDVVPTAAPGPRLLAFNRSLASELGVDPDEVQRQATTWLSGSELPPGARPIAQAYAGHQFGSFNPGLGDGRALLLGEVDTPDGRRVDIALKGSGRTPYSRGGDGRAGLGPVLREYLMGEAMHALGIPTTRALAAVATGDTVIRRRPEPGAVLTRVAASHLRVGTFQYFAARQRPDDVARLVHYALGRHGGGNTPLDLLDAVVDRQAHLVAEWMAVGFVHGVMNTDNCSISGETIDYGPCAFVEPYDLATVYSSIDHHGRYAFGQQPQIAAWNVARLAEALLVLIDTDAQVAVAAATEVLDEFPRRFTHHHLAACRRKLALDGEQGDDEALVNDWFGVLAAHRVDLTLAWRYLADAAEGDPAPLRTLAGGGPTALLDAWLARWSARAGHGPALAARLRSANAIYVPRNEHVEAVIDAAVDGDLAPFERLVAVLSAPFAEHAGAEDLAVPSSERFLATHRTFCGT